MFALSFKKASTAAGCCFIIFMLLISYAPASFSLASGTTELTAAASSGHYITLTSPNAQHLGLFGSVGEVAISSKLSVVGAFNEAADGYAGAGHAYVFNAATGRLITNLTSPSAQQGGAFGGSVAISSKFVVVGAPDETADGLQLAGHAYVFDPTTGKLLWTLTSPDAQQYGSFGLSVAVSGDLAIIGAPAETANDHTSAGHAYEYDLTSGKLVVTLKSPKAQDNGYFGTSVSISSELSLVGAPYETVKGYTYAGHAYVFNSANGRLVSTLTSPNAQQGGYFAYSAGISGKLAVVGALYESASGYEYAGHSYIFNATSGKLTSTLTSPHAQEEGFFGISVAISGDYTAVGAYAESADGYTGAGHAYIFNSTTGKLIGTLSSPHAQQNGQFGSSVALSGKLALVGAPLETANGYTDAGHAYIHSL